jgi:hypothetical protein
MAMYSVSMETPVADIVSPDGQPFNQHGVKVTMPFFVTISATFLVEAQSEHVACVAVQRATSFSAAISPYNTGIEVSAVQPPPEMLLKMQRKTQ